MSDAIIRRWEAEVAKADVQDWVETFRSRALPGMRAVEGFISVSFLTKQNEDPCHVIVLTKWRNMASINSYAGENASKAVVPDFMKRFIKSYDAEATFYDEVLWEGCDE